MSRSDLVVVEVGTRSVLTSSSIGCRGWVRKGGALFLLRIEGDIFH